MNSIISDLIQKQAEPEPSKPSGFDYLTKLVVPLLALVALIVADFRQERTLMWALLGVTVLSLLAGFLSRAAAWAKVRAGARRDERFARRAFPALRKLVERFGDFANQSHCDTVHYVALHELSQGRNDLFGKLGIPSVNFFQALWSNLSSDVGTQTPALANFRATVSDLSLLVSLYNNYCMFPVFEQLPQDLRGQLTDRAKSSLNACRERFVTFLNDYSNYLGAFDDWFAARYLEIRQFSAPRPL